MGYIHIILLQILYRREAERDGLDRSNLNIQNTILYEYTQYIHGLVGIKQNKLVFYNCNHNYHNERRYKNMILLN